MIAAAAVLALLGTHGAAELLGAEQARELADIERRLLPRLGLGPRMEADFERLSRTMQDAVAAQDEAALESAESERLKLFEAIRAAESSLGPSAAAGLRWAINDYFVVAMDISRRMIAGETGVSLVDDVSKMQARQVRAKGLILRTTGLEGDEVSGAFVRVREAHEEARRWRLGVAFGGLLLVVGLTFSLTTNMLRALAHLSQGFARFGTGDFSDPIPVRGNDELGDVSVRANQMAASLRTAAAERDHQSWLDSTYAELSDELSDALEPHEVARKALVFLAKRLNGCAGALYATSNDGTLVLQGHYATAPDADGRLGPPLTVKTGDGLVGEAFLDDKITTIEAPEGGHLTIRTGLTASEPRSLVLVPLMHFGRRVGVAEFAFLQPCPPHVIELLLHVRGVIVSVLENASSSASLRELLAESRQQADRLTAQEEELRLNNRELVDQQDRLKRANEQLAQQQQVLGEQNHELEQAQRTLETKAEELGRVSSYKSKFLANMSHELRTPLNSMLLLSHLLAENTRGNLTDKQVEHAVTIHSAGTDLLSLINQVLDLSKIESGKEEIQIERTDIAEYANYIERAFGSLAEQKGLQLVVTLAPDAPTTLLTDRHRLERILTNLVGNAVKFTEQGSVSLTIEKASAKVIALSRAVESMDAISFAVADTGTGISPHEQGRIFAPFEQLEGAQQKAGTGLGLSIARESARLLGGDLVLQSQKGRGSTFTCILPRGEKAEAGRSFRRTQRVDVDDDRDDLPDEKPYLLVIEDDPVLAEQLVDIGRARGIRVVAIASGEEGVAFARLHVPVGIVLDVRLPDIDGWTVIDRLKRHNTTREIPVHFLSAVDGAHRGLALGAIGYLVKPASHAELAAAVNSLLPRKVGPSAILVVEDATREAQAVVALLRADGFEADHVPSAEAALDALASKRYGCVLLDIGLPGMNGLEFLEQLRARKELGAPRVVVHTGRALTKQETHWLEDYSEAVILKDTHSPRRLLEEARLFIEHVATRSGAVSSPGHSSRPGDVSLAGLTVLVAEDDMRTVYALSALLRGKGAEVLVADNGRDALDALDQHPEVNVVLMDVMMPEMDGYQAMSLIRKDVRFEHLPVIALTAKAMRGEHERCISAGASDYLSKPIDTDKLLTALVSWTQAETGRG